MHLTGHAGLSTALQALSSLALPELEALTPLMRVRVLQPGDALFRSNACDQGVYCLREGLLKLVYEDARGRQFVKAFIEAGRPFASATALSPEGRTSFAALALEPSVIERIEFSALDALAQRHLSWALALARAFQEYGQRKEQRELELLTLDAEARYRRFLSTQPALTARLPQKDIAAYLGVTPVGLSRIRARVLRQPYESADS